MRVGWVASPGALSAPDLAGRHARVGVGALLSDDRHRAAGGSRPAAWSAWWRWWVASMRARA